MNSKLRVKYYLLILAFPLFFILHGLNENFGLISADVIISLLLYYLTVAMATGFASAWLFNDFDKAFLFSFFILFVFFFFGLFEDFTKKYPWLDQVISYKFLLPGLLILSAGVGFYLKKRIGNLSRLSLLLSTILIICFAVEVPVWIYKTFTAGRSDAEKQAKQDDERIRNLRFSPSLKKPFIFWIVMDEYSATRTLKRKWNYDNNLDSSLRSKGFYIGDSAQSNYNYTLYSINSTLNMRYLPGFENHSVIRYKDAVGMRLALRDNNVSTVLEKNGYSIENYTIYDIKGYPTIGERDYDTKAKLLIDNQTLTGRIYQDIGWNFKFLMARDKKLADSVFDVNQIAAIAASRENILQKGMAKARQKVDSPKPLFFMFHLMTTHMPLIYHEDGSLDLSPKPFEDESRYLPCVTYANTVIARLVDSIQSMYRGKDYIIILQSDHAFKLPENDPLFESESCNILYAVYCSDNDYSLWKRSVTAVNSFRILFNKYFHTGLPLLEDHAYMLYAR